MKPFLLKERCPAQSMICTVIKGCEHGAVSYVEDDDEPLGGRIVFDYDKCKECGTCANVCCGKAVEMR